MQLIATIFHLTDMHLHVDDSGQVRDSEVGVSRLLRKLAARHRWIPLVEGMALHDEQMLAALIRDLPLIIEIEREDAGPDVPVLVFQTGDVEALGGLPTATPGWNEAFPSWAFLAEQVVDCGVAWTHLFGNHDTWPGVFPLARPSNTINRDRVADIPLLDGDWWEAVRLETPFDVPLVIARLNTVARDFWGELLASGRLTDIGPGRRPPADLLQAIREAFEPHRKERAVRIALMHHPPHAFAAGPWQRLTAARFHSATELAESLAASGVQLVIAGHRHQLDPAAGAEDYGWTQRPLTKPTVQLAAESPTQRIADGGRNIRETRSFCRYRLCAEDDGSTFSVERAVFRFSVDDDGFISGPEEATFAQLPFQ